MSTGCLTLGKSLINKASWLAEQPEEEQLSVIEDQRVIANENLVYEGLAAHVTPFITTLDEASVHVGALSPRSPPFVRLRALNQRAGFGWKDCKAAFDQARRSENRVERMVCDVNANASEKRILQRLSMCRLEMISPKAKLVGNSQFEAISVALWGSPVFHPLLRQLAVNFMRCNPEEYRVFLGEDFDAYLRGMSKVGTSGDELTLRAVADHFGVVMNIITADSFMWFLRYAPQQTKSQREVFVAHVAPFQYMPIRRRSPMTLLRLNLTWSADKASRQAQAAQQLQQQQQPQQLAPPTPAGQRPAGAPPPSP